MMTFLAFSAAIAFENKAKFTAMTTARRHLREEWVILLLQIICFLLYERDLSGKKNESCLG
jgi:hypothetical protein